MSKICTITGKKALKGNNVSHSNIKTKRRFYPNLQEKKFYIPETDEWVVLKVSAKGIKHINKNGKIECKYKFLRGMSMNQYFKNLNKIEFVITNACTGRCKHCSEGEHTSCGERIEPQIAAEATRKIAEKYDIRTVMTFGGEPLLYPESVCAVMKVAKELNIPIISEEELINMLN